MIDTEVENTLREIRERVRAEAGAVALERRAEATHETASEAPSIASDALERLEANLASTARTWDKLPPLTSYRRGLAARLELWLKRQVKRATHWFTWEQVNFNAAVNNALRDALSALLSHEQHILHMAELQRELAALHRHSAESDRRFVEFDSRLTALETEIATHVESRFGLVDQRLGSITVQLRGEIDEVKKSGEGQRASIEQLRYAQRERIEQLLDEQRVSLKQLSLERGEDAVLADRARRRTELHLEELAARVEELRTGLEELRRARAETKEI